MQRPADKKFRRQRLSTGETISSSTVDVLALRLFVKELNRQVPAAGVDLLELRETAEWRTLQDQRTEVIDPSLLTDEVKGAAIALHDLVEAWLERWHIRCGRMRFVAYHTLFMTPGEAEQAKFLRVPLPNHEYAFGGHYHGLISRQSSHNPGPLTFDQWMTGPALWALGSEFTDSYFSSRPDLTRYMRHKPIFLTDLLDTSTASETDPSFGLDSGKIGDFSPRDETSAHATERLLEELRPRLRRALDRKEAEDKQMAAAVDVPEIRTLHPYKWLTRYQVLGESMRAIALSEGKNGSHVSRSIHDAAKVIGISVRSPHRGGRPPKCKPS